MAGIETAEEQVKALFSRSLKDAVASLKATLASLKKYEKKGINKAQVLDQAYFEGDADRLLAIIEGEMKESTKEQKALLKRLLQDRNQTMAQRVIALLNQKPHRRFLFAFGVAHFLGKESVIELLQRAGFQSRRLLAPKK